MYWIAGILLLILFLFWPTNKRRCSAHVLGACNALKRNDWPGVRRQLQLARPAAERLKGKMRSHFLAHIERMTAQADYRDGKFADCEEHLKQAAAHIEEVTACDMHMQLAEIDRLYGDLCIDRGQGQEATEHFRKAVASGQSMGTRR